MAAMGWTGKPIKWIKGRTLYISVPFTWNLPAVKGELEQCALDWDRAIVGGPAVALMPDYLKLTDKVQIWSTIDGVLQMAHPMATRTTLGCPRSCSFCGVGHVEGGFCELTDWPDLPLICDSNLLAASDTHFERVIARLRGHDWSDFNQGLDCRLMTPGRARLLASLKRPTIRMALDHDRMRDKWSAAFDTLRSAGIAKSNIRTYCLIGGGDSPSEARSRCEFVESSGVKPLPMWLHGLGCLKKNEITRAQADAGWTDYERRRLFQWYYWHKRAVAEAGVVSIRGERVN